MTEFDSNEFKMKEMKERQRCAIIDEAVESYLKGSLCLSCKWSALLECICRSLSRMMRYNGITENANSVLSHSWLVGVYAKDYAPEELKRAAMLCGMMHDYGEVITGDFVKPLKSGHFSKIYDEYYLPLEKAFRDYVGRTVYGISDFSDLYESVSSYVDKADKHVAELEMKYDLDSELLITEEYFGAMTMYLARKLTEKEK